jgi:hypothetical protein
LLFFNGFCNIIASNGCDLAWKSRQNDGIFAMLEIALVLKSENIFANWRKREQFSPSGALLRFRRMENGRFAQLPSRFLVRNCHVSRLRLFRAIPNLSPVKLFTMRQIRISGPKQEFGTFSNWRTALVMKY